MKATLIMYSALGLNKTEASKLSKKLIGYRDQSNKAQYTYERKGLVTGIHHIIVTKSTFIVPKKESKEIISQIEKNGGKIQSWDIDISNKFFKS